MPIDRALRDLERPAGTDGYLSPEVGSFDKYCSRSDVFSAGAVLYQLLAGRKVHQGDLAMLWAGRPLEELEPGAFGGQGCAGAHGAGDLVGRMLAQSPWARPTAAEALSHPWVADHGAVPLDALSIVDGL